MGLLEKLDQFPPTWCRLVARKKNGCRGMTTREIAEASGLPKSTVSDISKRTSWSGLQIETIEKFSTGCGVDLLRCHSQKRFLKTRKMVHLTRGDANQRRMYAEILQAQ